MTDKPKQKNWYFIKVDGIAPVTVEYRVLAEDENNAFEILERQPSLLYLNMKPNIDIRRLIKKRVSIKNSLTGFINWIRNF